MSPEPAHVGVDASCWQNNRGYGRHARALLRALVDLDQGTKYTFFLDQDDELEPLPPRVEKRVVRTSASTVEAAAADGSRSPLDMLRVGRALADPQFDILLFPTVYSYVPVLSRARKVVLIHDVIAEKFPELTLPRPLSRLFWKAKVALGRWQASALVTVSEHSKKGIVEHFGTPPDRVHVVGEANDPVFRVVDGATATPRLLELGVGGARLQVVYVGGFGPHKNLDLLLDVFAEVARSPGMEGVKLVMVGEYKKEVFHSAYESLVARMDTLGIADRVIFPGYLSDEELVLVLNLSTVLVLPSLLEGFGLPGVEACACGLPIIATTESPLPQLLAEGGIFLDPHDREGWRREIHRVLEDAELRDRLRAGGIEAAGRLTWPAAAQQMMDVFEHVRPGHVRPGQGAASA